jgi:subtilisin family serine protease
MQIAVIDTGVDYTHPDLGGGFGPGFKVFSGYDFVNQDTDPFDDNGHGTTSPGLSPPTEVKGVALRRIFSPTKSSIITVMGGFDVIAAIEKATNPMTIRPLPTRSM